MFAFTFSAKRPFLCNQRSGVTTPWGNGHCLCSETPGTHHLRIWGIKGTYCVEKGSRFERQAVCSRSDGFGNLVGTWNHTKHWEVLTKARFYIDGIRMFEEFCSKVTQLKIINSSQINKYQSMLHAYHLSFEASISSQVPVSLGPWARESRRKAPTKRKALNIRSFMESWGMKKSWKIHVLKSSRDYLREEDLGVFTEDAILCGIGASVSWCDLAVTLTIAKKLLIIVQLVTRQIQNANTIQYQSTSLYTMHGLALIRSY